MKGILVKCIYGLLYLLSLLPIRIHYLFSDFFYLVVYYLVGYRVKLVRKNLANSFPEKSVEELKKTEKAFYHWFCDYLVETIKMMTISEKELRKRMVFVGTELIDQCVRENQSCALYLGHYCNWEWITSIPLWMKEKASCGQIYHPLENADIDRIMLKQRNRFGSNSIPMAETLRQLMKFKSENVNSVIGYISDQTPFWNNIHHWVMFLNQDTPVLTGTERLVRKMKQAAFYIDISRVKRGYYKAEYKLITREPQKMKEFEITDMYFRMLEDSIRRAPAYWLWTHNRWKRSHEEFNIRFDPSTGRVNLDPDLEKVKRERGLV